MRSPLTLLFTLVLLGGAERVARAQACCVGASGLTPGWLTHHERALVGAQLRLSETHGTYPSSGPFFDRTPGRDARVETSLFATYRLLPRAQVSAFLPLITTRRRAGATTEGRTAFGDFTLLGRYDLIRAGESQIPGIAVLSGAQAPTGKDPSEGTGSLAADANGTGAWEINGGVSIEQTFGHVLLHGTVLGGIVSRTRSSVSASISARAPSIWSRRAGCSTATR